MLLLNSPVFAAMLGGSFQESGVGTVILPDDDVESLKLALGIMYQVLMDGQTTEVLNCGLQKAHYSSKHKMKITESVSILLDKYMFDGISGALNLRIETIDLENKLKNLERQHLLQKENTRKYMTTTLIEELKAWPVRKQTLNIKAGDLVDQSKHQPPVGTLVRWNSAKYGARGRDRQIGTIIDTSVDGCTEVDVRWADGTVAVTCHCNKKGQWDLEYV
jgi:hypothetical protein